MSYLTRAGVEEMSNLPNDTATLRTLAYAMESMSHKERIEAIKAYGDTRELEGRTKQVEKLLQMDDFAGIPRFQGDKRSALERELKTLKDKTHE